MDRTACAGVEGSDALPHPASARRNTGVSRNRVMADTPMPASVNGLRFLISSVSFLVVTMSFSGACGIGCSR